MFKVSRAALFRRFRDRPGHRVFRMAPLHHHFEMLGLGAGHRRDPLLDHHRPLRRRRPRHLLRRVGRRRMNRPDPADPGPPRRLGRRPGRGRRLRRLRLRRRRQPDRLGAAVTALDESTGDDRGQEKAELLEVLGADVRLGDGATATLPDDVDLVVTSPGWRPDAPLLAQAAARGIPVWGEVELAWRLRDPDAPRARGWPSPAPTARPRPCRCSTRSCAAAGLRSVAVGNVGRPVVEAVMDPEPYDVLAVELSSFQLHYIALDGRGVRRRAQRRRGPPRLVPRPAAWPRTPPTRAASTSGCSGACVYNVADPETERLVREADVVEGARAIGFTLGMPAVGHARRGRGHPRRPRLHRGRATSAAELCTIADLGSPAPHMVANALAAAALARAHGVPPSAVRDGLRGFRPDGHRIAMVAERGGVDLGRRLQGDQPARRALLAARPTTRSSGSPAGWPRARASTTWSPTWRAGCAAWCCSAATAP